MSVDIVLPGIQGLEWRQPPQYHAEGDTRVQKRTEAGGPQKTELETWVEISHRAFPLVGCWYVSPLVKAAFEFLSLSPSMLYQTAQAAITNTVAWAFKQQEFVSSPFWAVRNLRSKCQLLVRALFSLCPHRAERRRESKQALWCLSL